MSKVCHVISGLGDGGAEALLYRLCAAQVDWDHVVISLKGQDKYFSLLRDIGVEVHTIEMSGSFLDIFKVIDVWKLIRNIKPDAVQTWMYHADLIGGIAARLAGVRTVVWGIHSTVLKYRETSLTTIFIVYLLAVLSYIVPKRIVLCANQSKEAHANLLYNKNKMKVIANGYDLSHFCVDFLKRQSWKHEFGVYEDCLSLGMVGRYDSYKDHNNLIRALYLLKERAYDFRCFMVGERVDEQNIERHRSK